LASVRPPRRPVLALFATLIAASSVLAVMPGAVAEPRPTLRQAQVRVAALHHEAEAATERYDAGRVQMAEVQIELRQVTKRLEQAKAEVGGMQAAMGQMAAASYKSGGVDMAMQLMFADDPQAFLQQATALDQLSRRQAVTLRRVTTARQQLAQDRLVVDQQRERLAAIQAQLKAEQRTIEDRIASAEGVVASLRAIDRARLEAARRASLSDALAARSTAPRASRAVRQATRRSAGGSHSYTGPASGRAAVAVRTAYAQLGDPYVYGAGGPNAFDCSGLTSFAWRAAGVSLPHSSSAQYGSGRHVSRSALQPGDLVFFYSPISHVGIYIGGGKMIDAPHPGLSVRITSISQLPYSGAVRP
jgi:cell wall-associated NlpC family hydrolase